MFFTLEKLTHRMEELSEYRYREAISIPQFAFKADEQGTIGEYPPAEHDQWGSIQLGQRWSGYDSYFWLQAHVAIPAHWKGRTLLGRFAFGRTGISNIAGFESLLFINNQPYQGVDSNHQEVFFPDSAAGSELNLCFRIWSGLNNHEPILLNHWNTLGPVKHRFYQDPSIRHRDLQEYTLSMAQIAYLDDAADDLYFLARAGLDTVRVLSENNPERVALLSALNRAFLAVDWSKPGSRPFYDSVSDARDTLRSELGKTEKHSAITVHCIGHTHIDVAWLWQLKHSREKAARSFSTVLRLMEKFPEYNFLQTQPQLYDYMKSDYPHIFEQIKKRVKDGNWEAAGGMWLESDCNLTSGESLVRQILMGTRFLRDEFGVECRYLWLPDVFGYSWALPQILRKSGLDTFMTTKINMMSQYNPMPHHTFQWKGIDGTDILTHFAGYTYNGMMNAESIQGLWSSYKDKEINQDLLFVHGYGDGGGGVNREMLEMRRRLDEMPGMPHVAASRVDDYFDKLQQTVKETDQYVHTWEGELYFEFHRGTYTSQAFVKRANRQCELALRETEWLNVMNCLLRGDWSLYSGKLLHEAWKIVLRNQFHDIIPGSSIREVYEDCEVEYAEAAKLIQQAWTTAAEGLVAMNAADSRWYTIMNGSTGARSDLVRIPAQAGMESGSWLDERDNPLTAQRSGDHWLVRVVGVPAMGAAGLRFAAAPGGAAMPAQPVAATAPAAAGSAAGDAAVGTPSAGQGTGVAAASGTTAGGTPSASHGAGDAVFHAGASGIATPFYEIEWNQQGQLTRIFDRQNGREVLADGECGNILQVFEDKPLANDAWDIDIFYQEKMREVTELTEVSVMKMGPLRAVVRMVWTYADSTIRQDMVLYAHNRRIDFETVVDWHEHQQLLKVAFPVAIRATEAAYDIQYGNVKRPTHWNTSWDYARFETVGHQWADLSERGYGVSLLNDCKYGYDIKNNVMRLSLIRSAIFPDYAADQGEHIFTYALFPHAGDWVDGGTAIEAWALNNPLSIVEGKSKALGLSLFTLSANHAMIDAVKKAEDCNAVILRLHEFTGSRGHLEITSGLTIRSWQECDLMERPITSETEESSINSFLKPYEIKTFIVKF